MRETITALLKKTILALLSAAFIAALLVPTLAATKPVYRYTKNGVRYVSTAKVAPKAKRHYKHKRHHKVMPVRKAWPTAMSSKPKHVKSYPQAKMGDRSYDRSKSTTERGLTTSAGKAVKFTKRTLTVPQKNPNAAPKKTDRSKSTLERGLTTSAHKAGKFIKRTVTPPKK